MKTKDDSQEQDGARADADTSALPRPSILNEQPQPAQASVFDSAIGTPPDAKRPRSAMADNDLSDDGGGSWPFMLDHGQMMRPAVPERGQADALFQNEPLTPPSAEARPSVPEHDKDMRPEVPGVPRHDGAGEIAPIVEGDAENDWPRPAMTEDDKPDAIAVPEVEAPVVEAPPETVTASPTKSADLVTVEEAVEIFRERGLPRHMRTIQKYCSRKTGRVLESYQVPTENGIRYMIERSSIDRFIGDAATQAPTGKIEGEKIVEPLPQDQGREQVIAPPVDLRDIFKHPLVQRLEAQGERLEERNDNLQLRIQNVLEHANQSLVELQKAAAVAQSESLGKFLLESERIRGGQEKTPPLSVNRGESTVPDYDV